MKKKTQKPPSKPRNGAALIGSWRHQGRGPEIKFRMRDSSSGLKVRFEFPSAAPDMTEKAWRALFRFMLATMGHMRPEKVSEEALRWVRWKREERFKRYKKRRLRHRRLYPKTTSNPKPKPDPIPDFVPTGPSAELLETAKAKLEQDT